MNIGKTLRIRQVEPLVSPVPPSVKAPDPRVPHEPPVSQPPEVKIAASA